MSGKPWASGRKAGVAWTGAERQDTIRWFQKGMSIREIAVALGRSTNAVSLVLGRNGMRHPSDVPIPPADRAYADAKKALAQEIAAIRAERTSAPVFRIRPEEWP